MNYLVSLFSKISTPRQKFTVNKVSMGGGIKVIQKPYQIKEL